MATNAVYRLTGDEVSVTYDTGSSSLELTLDSSYSPFDGTHQVAGGDVVEQPTDGGVQLTGALHYETVGRGGPISRTSSFTLFLPTSPEASEDGVDHDATGAVVFADPEPRGDVAPAYRAQSLTGTVSVPAVEPPGRF